MGAVQEAVVDEGGVAGARVQCYLAGLVREDGVPECKLIALVMCAGQYFVYSEAPVV